MISAQKLLRFFARPALVLLLLTVAAVLIHGYHLGVEDQDVYLAAVNKDLSPELYPVNSVFFTEQMKSSRFIPIIAGSIRLTHLPVPWAIFLWHVVSIYVVLLGCWGVASACFASGAARWFALTLVTVVLTLPIAGTALFVVDTYLHPRAPASAAILLALTACLHKKWLPVIGWMAVAVLMHPLMALFGASLILFVAADLPKHWEQGTAAALALLPLGLLSPPSAEWIEATAARRYYFPMEWTWYEWMGLICPVLMVFWFWGIARRHKMAVLERLSLRLGGFAVFQFIVGALMTIPVQTRQLSSLQPMRWLHIFYFLFLIMIGGLCGQFFFKQRVLRWALFFLPLAAVMFLAQRDSFEHSSHIDWPWREPRNAWARAFAWSGTNTPEDAVFAVDPKYMQKYGADNYGLRGLARRSMLAEDLKDPGAATVFPSLASQWSEQVHAQRGIERFSRAQFANLRMLYGVSYVVLPVATEVPLECPYRNEAAQVCLVR